MEDRKKKLRDLKRRIKAVPDSRFAILIYVGTACLVSAWMLISPCLMTLVLPVLSLLIIYKFYDEKNLKKILVAGVIIVLVMALLVSFYQVHLWYNKEPTVQESEHLKNGTVNPLYGNADTEFNFTVEIEDGLEGNYTVQLNITHLGTIGPIQDEQKVYNMSEHRGSNGTYYKNLTLGENLYNYSFSLKVNRSDGSPQWEETQGSFGPLTISKRITFISRFIPQTVSMFLVYVFGISLLWWRKKMKRSREESTEGLDEKEEELEDYCPECGALLEGESVCPRCGEKISEEELEEMMDEEGKSSNSGEDTGE